MCFNEPTSSFGNLGIQTLSAWCFFFLWSMKTSLKQPRETCRVSNSLRTCCLPLDGFYPLPIPHRTIIFPKLHMALRHGSCSSYRNIIREVSQLSFSGRGSLLLLMKGNPRWGSRMSLTWVLLRPNISEPRLVYHLLSHVAHDLM